MLTYLLIGVIVEILIIVIRTIRGVATWDDVDGQVLLAILFFGLINILIWPITIIAEVANTINGV